MLLRSIEENAGIRYRELLGTSGFVNEVLSYHISQRLTSQMFSKFTGSLEAPNINYYSLLQRVHNILKSVRHKPVRQIMLFLLGRVLNTFNEIVDHMQKAPFTVSLHLRRLREGGNVSITYGEYHLCSLTNKDIVCEVLAKYKASLSDRSVESYQEMMEEL